MPDGSRQQTREQHIAQHDQPEPAIGIGNMDMCSGQGIEGGQCPLDEDQRQYKERKVRMTDSIRNWAISAFREEPITFRMPTSLALFSERAVERFVN